MSEEFPRNEKGQTEAEFLKEYDLTRWPRPSVTADNVVFTKLKGRNALLLIKRRNHPFIGCWALPGGFLDPNEDPEEAAKRELLEETGVTGVTPRQLGAYGRPNRDPRGWIITVAFVSQLPDGADIKASDDAAEAALFLMSTDWKTKRLVLTHSETGEALSIPIEFENGRARFIPVPGLASDHPQIILDAVLKNGLL
jgi:ADP-ribose pyrophosphatase YjhB (NUDIX family)